MNHYRGDISWSSNNSVRISTEDIEFYEPKVKEILKLTLKYSELNFNPNIQKYGRMADPESFADASDDIMINPCGVANLLNAELCNLREVYLVSYRPPYSKRMHILGTS